jgi:hypothetical protein
MSEEHGPRRGAEAVLAETVSCDYFAAGLSDCVSILAPSGLGQSFGL